MATPLVRNNHAEPLQSNDFSEAMVRSGYGAIHEMLGQPNITGSEALRQLNYGGKVSERTLVEMYQGRNLVLANRVELELRNTDSVLFRICPLQKTEHLGKRVMYRTRYKQSVLGPLATYGLARHMNFQRSSTSFELSGFGIGFQFELQSLLQDEGRDIFNNYVQMAASNTVLTAEICAIESIIGCHETAKALDKFFPQTVGSLMDLVSTWNNNAFAIHKKGNGIQQVVGWLKKARVLLKVAAPEALLVPQNTAEQLAFGNPEARDVFRAGSEAVRVRASGAAVYDSVNGLRMVELAPEPISDTGAGLYDALSHVAEFGLFYVADNNSTMGRAPDAPHNTCNERGVAIFTMRNNGNREVVRPETMIQGDLAFDAASGMLNEPVLQELAQNYETLCRAKQMSLHISPNGDPLVDPNIAFDEQGAPFVVRHFGDIDPAYLSETFIKTLARINQQELERKIGRERMQHIREMLLVLEQSASQGISASADQASVLEAFATAVALDVRNRVGGQEASHEDLAALTPGNAHGADFLPPVVKVDGVNLIGCIVESNTTAAITFLDGIYGTSRNGAPIPAPAFPPGCSSANWAAYIADGLATGDVGVMSWVNASSESKSKFEAVARGWRAFEQYFDEQRSVFSLGKSKNAENVLMDPNSCPTYMKPSGGNESLQAKLAYFQQVFVGMRGPLAIGFVDYGASRIENVNNARYRREYDAAYPSRSQAVEQASRTDSDDDDDDTALASQMAGVTGSSQPPMIARNRGGARVDYLSSKASNSSTRTTYQAVESAIDTLTGPESILLADLANALVLKSGAQFNDAVKRAFAVGGTRGSGLPIPTGLDESSPSTARLFLTPFAYLSEGNGKTVTITSLVEGGVDGVRKASFVLNELWRTLERTPNFALNDKNMSVIASKAMRASESSTSAESAAARGVRDYSRNLGADGQTIYKHYDEQGGGRYVVTRLQVSQRGFAGLFGNVSTDRAYRSSLRPTSFQMVGRIIAPPQSNSGTVGMDTINQQAAMMYTKGRADSYIDRTRGSLTTEGTQRESRGAPLGPMSFYVEHNHGGANSSGAAGGNADPYGDDGVYSRVGGKRGATSVAAGGVATPFKRTMGGASVHSYAGVNYSHPVPASEFDMYNITTRDANQGTATGDLVLHTPVQINATRWMIARLNILERLLSDPLERAMALTFLMTPIHRDLLMHMVQHNYVLPRSYLLIQPFIRLAVYAAYAVSYNIGQTLYAYPNISIGSDANTLLCTARFSTKLGAAVLSPEQVTPIPLFKFGDYLGGATAAVVPPGTIYNEMLQSSYGVVHQYTYNPQDYANRNGDLFIIGTGCDSGSFGDELPLGGYFRPANITSRLSEQDSANMLRQRYPSALYLNLLCGFDRIGNQQAGVPNTADNYHLLTDLIAPMSESYAGRLCFQGPQNNYNPVTGQFDRVFSAGSGPLGALAPNCGSVLKGDVGMITYQESQRLVSTPLAIAY